MTFDAAARALADRVLHSFGSEPPRILVIDGRSGSGKTTLADACAEALGAVTLHLDDLYPGWAGLRAGALAVPGALRTGRYRRFDWARNAPGEVVTFDTGGSLVVEGCGALTAGTMAAARELAGTGRAVGLWLACAEPTRRERALARDGDLFRPHWDAWAAQERAHFAAELPLARADAVIHCHYTRQGAVERGGADFGRREQSEGAA